MKIIYLICMALCVNLNAFAQIKKDSISIPKYGRVSVVMSHEPMDIGENIENVELQYLKGKTAFVRLNYAQPIIEPIFNPDWPGQGIQSEGYDLSIRGDSLVLVQKYPNLQIAPNLPLVRNEDWHHGRTDSTIQYYIYKIWQYRDSTVYNFLRGQEGFHGTYPLLPAKLEGDFEAFTDSLSKELNKLESLDSSDYPFVLDGVMTNKGKYTQVQLIYGESSAFSALVKKGLEEAQWRPALIVSSGARMKVKMRVYVTLDKQGNVSIELPKRMFNFTGH